MKKIILLTSFLSLTNIFAIDIIRIEVGKDYNGYSNQDLKRRVWELERAVFQLQQKVFMLEVGNKPTETATWICKVKAMGNTFSATGISKAMAENAVLEKCKADPKTGNGFHCDEPTCSQ
jgi:hypothetical protein